jgi:hypothetical protein
MLALIGAGIGAISGLIGGIGKKKQAAAAEKSAKEQAALSRAGTEMELSRIERAGFQAQGAIQAGAGGSGLKTSGSALDILKMSSSQIALDLQLRKTQGEQTAKGYEAQAAAAKAEGSGAILGGVLKGASSLLSGGVFG